MSHTGLIVVPPSGAPTTSATAMAAHRVANRAIACHAVQALTSAGIDDIAVVGAEHELDQVQQCVQDDGLTVRLTYLPQGDRSDLLGAISTAEDFIDERPAIVHFGDGLLGQQLDGVVHGREDPDLPDLLLLLHRSEGSRHGLPATTQRLLGLSELNGPGDRLALAGVCAFGPGALSRAVRTPTARDKMNLIGIAEHLAAEGHRLEAEVVRGWRRFRGDPSDLLELNRIVLDQQIVHHEVIDRGDNRIEGRAIIHPTAELHSSIILGPCIIGAHARVENSYIGPYTSIGARTEIEGAEIVRSIVADDVSIQHVGGRIEGSTIGPHSRIFRDFALPRAMRLHVGEGVEVALT